MSRNTTKLVIDYYFKLMTCFGPCSGPSSGHKSIYSRILYSMSHKIYQSKIRRDLVVVRCSSAVHDQVKIWIYHKPDNIMVIIHSRYLKKLE